MNAPVTGDEQGDAVLPAALRLVCALRDGDRTEVEAAFAEAAQVAGNWAAGAAALACVTAAMVPDPATNKTGVLLAWCQAPRTPVRRSLSAAQVNPPRRSFPTGLRPVNAWKPGENHPSAKVSTAQIEAMRAEYRPGVRGEIVRLMRKYQLGRSHVYRIVNGEARAAG